VRRIWNVGETVAAGDEARMAEQLAGWAERHGADTFILSVDGEDAEGQIERLAGDVAPAVREALGVTV
jgi:hypothetical protein